jgi:tRNA nucleotidyltransferase (CCA-adding enzyme)
MQHVSLPQPVVYLLHTLLAAGYEGYVVGGAVRDTLMQRETADWDFTTNATPEEIQSLFPKHFYDNTFGTVSVPAVHLFKQMQRDGWTVAEEYAGEVWIQEVFEITTYRKENGYSDKRRPDSVSWGTSIEEDLSRRDFTINAMAISVDGRKENPLNGLLAFARREPLLSLEVEVVDPYGGKSDLEKGLIRAVGEPEQRFAEDALRMMRAIRFGAQLGFKIETETMEAIKTKADLIEHISWERKRDELIKILSSNYPADGMLALYHSGLLEFLIPEMLTMREVEQGGHHIYDVWLHSLESLRNCPSTDPIVRLATLLHDIGKPKTARKQGPRGVTFYGHEVVGARMAEQIGRRLRLSNKEVEKLRTLVRWHMFVYDSQMTDAAIRRFIKRVGLENINDMMLLRVGDRLGGGSKATSWRLRELQQRIGEQLYEPLSLKDLKISGHELMEHLKIPPGPLVGKILNQLFEEVMEDSSKNDRDYLLERAKELNRD